jgi:hypothetical protein
MLAKYVPGDIKYIFTKFYRHNSTDNEANRNLCLQTFPKLLLLLVPKVATRSLYPECIANLKIPIDAFYRESRSGVNIAKRNITTGLFG